MSLLRNSLTVTITAMFFCISSLLLFLTLSQEAHAQTMLEPGAGAELQLNPPFPEPNSTVEVSVNAYTYETHNAIITWYVDGVAVPAFKNNRVAHIQTGEVGKKRTISATVAIAGGPTFTLKKDIVPYAVDIVEEAQTHIPSFYRGRTLPSPESRVRVIAIPHLGGKTVPGNLSYRWEQNGEILLGGPSRGRQYIDLVVSRYYGGYVTVTVFDINGNAVAQKHITFDATSPELYFYEENPLRGLSELAIKGNLSLIGDETTVHGEPYFMNTHPSQGDISYSWTIDGSPASPDPQDPHIITLRRAGGNGTAFVGLRSVIDTGIPEYVEGGFSINF